jgi:hypothetical protein
VRDRKNSEPSMYKKFISTEVLTFLKTNAIWKMVIVTLGLLYIKVNLFLAKLMAISGVIAH